MNNQEDCVASRTRSKKNWNIYLQEKAIMDFWKDDQRGWAQRIRTAQTNEEEARFASYWFRSIDMMEQEMKTVRNPNFKVKYLMPKSGQRW